MGQLEASAAHLQRDLAQARADIREARERLCALQGRAAKLPTRLFVSGSVLLILGAITGAAAFGPQLQAMMSAAVSISIDAGERWRDGPDS